ncbi:type II toxin-antitoxin system RelE/ParE family toxin [Rhizobium sp. Root483D2]|uniref:type II toxin-antitoxin system RelE/ParE family toxin n=1 Tax=Rhizobium sp. Root483D2 TaxID=1736545 RepID=UPI000713C118|nr:type II toxin-antitoxin system RelE/ParE family toxin [Rhizobium sp. Root483D2]KQY36212.1 plasmid stabilization protein [Rhizobium sp. Root483D2]
MPAVIFTPNAIRDLERLRQFLRAKNPQAARSAGEAILQGVRILGSQPHIGRLVEGLPEEFREWLIDFGDSGYVTRYRFDGEMVTILALRHQREAGF